MFDEEFKRVNVRQGNIQHVITLMAGERHADADFWNDYGRVQYHRLPISEPTTVDAYPSDIKRLKKLARQLAPGFKEGEGVWSVCYGGRNRSNLFAALLLIETGFSACNAIALLKRTRKASFQNKRFVRYLLENE
tara:strand:- start:17 stop:421 length:405 start_codon:yes stop_codon:yes gene_type:complete